MAYSPYYAVVYAYGKDGEEEAYMPCFNHEQVMARASKYEKVRVVRNGGAPFWLSLTDKEKAKYALPAPDDFGSEFMRDSAPECSPGKNKSKVGPAASLQHSDIFYDGWKGHKKTPAW